MSCRKGAASRVRRIVGGFSYLRVGFAAGPVIAGLFVYKERLSRSVSQYFRFSCQYHSTIAPYPFIPLPPTLYNVFLLVLQLSPVSIIPTMLHTHSFTHLPPSLYNVFLPVLQLSPVSIIPTMLHTHSFTHLPPALHNVFLPVHQLSPVSIIPPLLHNHSSTTHTV